MQRFRVLQGPEIECRVKQVMEKGAIVLLYKTARTDMDLLDETVGAENWQCDYKEIKGNLYCGIGVRTGEDKPYVWKWDCGIESREDEDGNQKKGEASDAFKRAGFRWGIGRELYTAPFIWIPADKLSLEKREYQGKAKWFTRDTFCVEKITYDDAGRIAGLALRNEKTHRRVFVWERGQA